MDRDTSLMESVGRQVDFDALSATHFYRDGAGRFHTYCVAHAASTAPKLPPAELIELKDKPDSRYRLLRSYNVQEADPDFCRQLKAFHDQSEAQESFISSLFKYEFGCGSFPTTSQPRYISHFGDQGQRKKGCFVVI